MGGASGVGWGGGGRPRLIGPLCRVYCWVQGSRTHPGGCVLLGWMDLRARRPAGRALPLLWGVLPRGGQGGRHLCVGGDGRGGRRGGLPR